MATVNYNKVNYTKKMTIKTVLNVYKGMTYYAQYEPNLNPGFDGAIMITLNVTSYSPTGTPMTPKTLSNASLTQSISCYQVSKYVLAGYTPSGSLDMIILPMVNMSKFIRPCTKTLRIWNGSLRFKTSLATYNIPFENF